MRDTATAELFAADISTHGIRVTLDAGLHRHIQCSAQPHTLNQSFQVTTFPMHLCITGDMGSFTFSRQRDMLAFFRSDSPHRVDYNYLAEKCVAQDTSTAVWEYDQAACLDDLTRMVSDFIECYELGPEAATALRDECEEMVLAHVDESEEIVRAAADAFEFFMPGPEDAHGYRARRGVAVFTDLFEHNWRRPSFHFSWCCRAILWAVYQYDAWGEHVIPTPDVPPFRVEVRQPSTTTTDTSALIWCDPNTGPNQ